MCTVSHTHTHKQTITAHPFTFLYMIGMVVGKTLQPRWIEVRLDRQETWDFLSWLFFFFCSHEPTTCYSCRPWCCWELPAASVLPSRPPTPCQRVCRKYTIEKVTLKLRLVFLLFQSHFYRVCVSPPIRYRTTRQRAVKKNTQKKHLFVFFATRCCQSTVWMGNKNSNGYQRTVVCWREVNKPQSWWHHRSVISTRSYFYPQFYTLRRQCWGLEKKPNKQIKQLAQGSFVTS